jgi:molybdopterin/thiamine biosynthesis adenylyltransferase
MSFSLLSYNTDIPDENPNLPSKIDIGEVTLVGAGAIGSAVIYTLKCLDNVCGKLDIVDGDKYTNTNLNRYIIADESTIGKYKVDIAKNILSKHSNLNVVNHQKVYDDFKKDHPRIDTLISAVDKKITGFNMQADIPRLIIDAATTDSLIDLARVDFGTKGACLGCLYLPEQQDNLLLLYISQNTGLKYERVKYLYERSEGVNTEDVNIMSTHMGTNLEHCIGDPIESVYKHEYCGSSKVNSDKDTNGAIIAPVSFISALAGVLVTCELIKDRYYPEYKVNNHFLIDTFKLPNPKLHNFKSSNLKCPYCNENVYLDVFREKWS